jgi:hypothetical protein
MQPVLIVARPVKCLSNLRKVSQLDVQIVSTRTNLKEALVAEMETEAEIEAETEEDSVAETIDLEKCIRQNVLIVEMNVKSLSSQQARSQSIVEIVLISN